MNNLDFFKNIYNYLKRPTIEIYKRFDDDYQEEVEEIIFNKFENIRDYEDELKNRYDTFRTEINNIFKNFILVNQNKDLISNYLLDFDNLCKDFYISDNYITISNLVISYNGEEFEKEKHSKSIISDFIKINYNYSLKFNNLIKSKVEDLRKNIINPEQHILFLQYLFDEINLKFDENIYKLVFNNNLLENKSLFELIENNIEKLKNQENLLSVLLIVNQYKLYNLQEKIILDLQKFIKFEDNFKIDLKNSLIEYNKEKFKKLINNELQNTHYLIIHKDTTERGYQLILYMIFRQIFEISELILEDVNVVGRADIVINSKYFIYIFEIKVGNNDFKNSCKDALKQIDENCYAAKYDLDARKIIKSAIVFNTENRQIEEIEFVEHKKLI